MALVRRLAFAALLVAAACGGSTAPRGETRRLALVDERISSRAAVWLPITARVGAPFDVEITAIVGTECASFTDADVHVAGLVATVTPYVTIDPRCGGHVPFEARSFPVRFDRAGAGLVRVRVRSAAADGAETVIERAVTVGP